MEKEDEVQGRPQVRKLNAKLLEQFSQDDGDGLLSPLSPAGTQSSKKKKEFKKYDSLKIFKSPVQLISVDETKRLHFNEDVIAELQKVDHDVNVIAVVGLYRSGKSTLLNRLAAVKNAFDIGHSTNAKTLGIWIMCLPHPTQESQVLVLLDTEGLGAVLEDKLLEDRWHFLLATLLSSTLVYNHKGVLDEDAVKKLSFLKDLKTSISVLDSDNKADNYFDLFFPSFVMVIRDNNLETTDAENNPISQDQYLENVLTFKNGKTDSIVEYNLPRELIRKYFKERKCFMIAPPGNFKVLDKRLSASNVAFEKDVDSFVQYIYGCKPKRMKSDRPLNGRMFASLVTSYVGFIQKGKPPCIHTAVKEMIILENQNLVISAQKVYTSEMQQRVRETMPDTATMAKFHLESTDKAIEYLRKVIIYDEVELFMGKAVDAFQQVLDRLIKTITKDSENICWGRLNFLNMRIQKKIGLNAYQNVSGYDEYINDIEWIIKQYKKTSGLGPKKARVLQTYLDGKQEEEKVIYDIVKNAQEEMHGKEPKTAIIDRKCLQRLSADIDCVVWNQLIKAIEEDQAKQKKMLTLNFQHFGNLKDKELDRQKVENPEIAAITEMENEQFKKMFLVSTSERVRPLPYSKPEQRCKLL